MTYTFRNIKNNKIITVEMKISEYDAYVLAHPELERYMDSAPAVTYNGKTFGSLDAQMPGGFKEVLAKIGEANPHTSLGDNYRKNKTIKEIKTREVVRNYAKKEAKKRQEAAARR